LGYFPLDIRPWTTDCRRLASHFKTCSALLNKLSTTDED
jgi:hypothetical protein